MSERSGPCLRRNLLGLLVGVAVATSPSLASAQEIRAEKHAKRTGTEVIGNQLCKAQTARALGLLAAKAPTYSRMARHYLGIIQCTEDISGVTVWDKRPKFMVSEAERAAGDIWYAGIIVHDANHAKQYHDWAGTGGTTYPDTGRTGGAVYVGSDALDPPASIYSGYVAEKECIEVQTKAVKKLGADRAMLDYLSTVIDTNYWENQASIPA